MTPPPLAAASTALLDEGAAGHGPHLGGQRPDVGNYLTTLGRRPQDDLGMLADLGMPVGALSGVW